MKFHSWFITGLMSLFLFSCSEKELALFEIDIPNDSNNLEHPVSFELENHLNLDETKMALFEIKKDKKIEIPFQVDSENPNVITWMVKPENTPSEKRIYKLYKGKSTFDNPIKAIKKDGAITIQKEDQQFLKYQFETLYPPTGIDTAYKRSGFIHPLWSPRGQELTRIQPEDHYHHYGIWNPWTHVEFEKDTIDFWNLAKRQGTVRFVNFESVYEGNVFAEFEALHEHIVFKNDGTEKVALNEKHKVRIYPCSGNNYFIVDFTFEMTCASESDFKILEYRYGGFGFRSTGYWDNQNSEVISSSGKTRKDVDGSKERWCIVQGDLEEDYGGIVMMSHPTNYNHPEPMRVWPEDQYGRGDMFVNYSPTKDRDWLLEPGKKYILKYRMHVFNGKFDISKAEIAWKQFAN